jgi:hypothetical protein
MMMTRVQIASTSSRMWVDRMTAFSAAMFLMRTLTSFFWLGSRPSVGSSRIRTGGSWRSACAKPTRCLKPLERVSIVWLRTEARWVSAIARSTRSRRAARSR